MFQLAVVSVKSALRQWFKFTGRTSRAEYWWASLVIMIAHFIASFSLIFLGASSGGLTGFGVGIIVSLLLTIALVILAISLGARRLHDINRSGWWQLLLFIPIIGWIFLLVWLCRKSHVDENRFGPESIVAERNSAEWLVPFIVWILLALLNGFASQPSDNNYAASSSGRSEYDSKLTVPAASSDVLAPAAVVPSAPTMPATAPDDCEQRMIDFAVTNNVDPKAYITSNQAYLDECRKTVSVLQSVPQSVQ